MIGCSIGRSVVRVSRERIHKNGSQIVVFSTETRKRKCLDRSNDTRTRRNVSSIQNTPHLKRKLGQHLLITESILDRIVDAAAIPDLVDAKKNQINPQPVRVLEIGPGTGNLTSALLNSSPHVHVHSVEFDTRMVERLQSRFSGLEDRLTIENIDFEQFEFATHELDQPDEVVRRSGRSLRARRRLQQHRGSISKPLRPHFDACVANIPYQLSSIIMSRLTTYMYRHPSRLQCAVLLVQDEFAQRLLAKPGTQSYSRLSVNTALIANVESILKVDRNHFLPPPKVDSRVIKLILKPEIEQEWIKTRSKKMIEETQFFERFDTLLRIAFHRKNKTLRALLISKTAQAVMDSNPCQVTLSSRVEEALEVCGLANKRAVQLPVQDFVQLMEALEQQGITFRPSDTRHFRT